MRSCWTSIATDRSSYNVLVAVEELVRAGVDHVTGSAGESHARVEVWLGDGWATDPTSGVPAGERHVDEALIRLA